MIHTRMMLQQSTFVLHGGTYVTGGTDFPEPILLEALNAATEPEYQFLKSFTVPSACKPGIRRELRSIGIHAGSLFPEVEHQGKYLSQAVGNR
jgi:hypothetical protein